MKKFIAFLLISVCLFSFIGCKQNENFIELDKTKMPVNYYARYHISTSASNAPDGKLEYNMEYAVSLNEETGQLEFKGKANEPWTNGQTGENLKEGRQIITTFAFLQYAEKEGISFGMPIKLEQEFMVDVEESFYTSFDYSFDYSLNSGFLKTKVYEKNSETGFKEDTKSVTLTKQFFDKDTLPFIMATFPESDGVINVCSGNRNSLQRTRYEFTEDETVETGAGNFNCKVVRIRPDTNFSVNSARIYFDKETGVPVMVTHDSSKMILTELKFN
ncbi:MAG: hypothetical protein E7365_05655 [Clostridiales bacterium]|nr:hypothetical protein [Clostridiales bacterium]